MQISETFVVISVDSCICKSKNNAFLGVARTEL